MPIDKKTLRASATFPQQVLDEIHRAADQGIYEIRGFGAKRSLPTFDDLVFLGASMSRYPLEGYREKCATNVVLGTRYAKQPVELKIPITIAGMSFGALGVNAKESLGRAATEIGTSTTTGDGGMTEEERQSSKTLIYQVLPSRYGLLPGKRWLHSSPGTAPGSPVGYSTHTVYPFPPVALRSAAARDSVAPGYRP